MKVMPIELVVRQVFQPLLNFIFNPGNAVHSQLAWLRKVRVITLGFLIQLVINGGSANLALVDDIFQFKHTHSACRVLIVLHKILISTDVNTKELW